MTRTRMFAATAAAAGLALSISACTGGDETPDQTETSGTSSSSQSPSVETRDRSKQVFDAYTPNDKVLASASGMVDIGTATIPPREVTFEVTSVRATDDATILSYQLTAKKETLFGVEGSMWFQQPALRVPGTKVRTQTVTAGLPEYKDRSVEICTCTALATTLTKPQAQEVVYPPLAEDVTEIDVIFAELDPVTVPVTR